MTTAEQYQRGDLAPPVAVVGRPERHARDAPSEDELRRVQIAEST